MARLSKTYSSVAVGGFTYIGALLLVVFFSVGSIGIAKVLASSERVERESELLFVGNQFRQAIGAYYSAGAGVPRYPQKLEELILDPRFPTPKRYLRRIYIDPITGLPEWGLIMAPEGGIMGIHSLSDRKPLKQASFDAPDRSFSEATEKHDGAGYSYRDWQFIYRPALQTTAGTVVQK